MTDDPGRRRPPTRGRPRLRLGDAWRLLVSWAAATLALVISSALLPGLDADSWWWFALAALVAGVAGLVLRPVLVEVSARVGWLAVLLAALLGQALITYLALRLVPAIDETPWSAFVATWVSALLGTLASWLTTAGTDDALVAALVHRGRRATVPDPEVPGVLFVQLDGVPFPVLQWAVQSGAVPQIRRWLSSGEYVLRPWTPQFPCTTPASQLGILHGTVDGVPAFRWYDRELGRVLVANRPADARIIEERAGADGGLLRDGGVSISNLFTGGAATSLMTMSRLEAKRGSTQTRRAFAWFVTSPSGFTRSLSRALAEIVKERWQARRQERRHLDPRGHRPWSFAVLRAVTNALLRDLNTALVAEQMQAGARSIYVDYVDYDEIAHHAGMFRPESLASLDGLDRTLGSLHRLAEAAPRPYHVVALSDHGQSQGTAFADRYGRTLADLCADLMDQEVTGVDAAVEGLGRADSLVGDVGREGLTGRIAARADEGLVRAQDAGTEAGADEPVVLGSGNLGLVYLRGGSRWSLDEIERAWPHLVRGLVEHPGVSFVAAVDAAGEPWAVGRSGRRRLPDGPVVGEDPLRGLGPHAARVLDRAVRMPVAPDLYVNSVVDPLTDDVAAFEPLVGSHGGLGGSQDRAVLLVPSELAPLVPDHVEGADALHAVLRSMLAACGHSTEPAPGRLSGSAPPTPPPSPRP